jgi:hypothetical protein
MEGGLDHARGVKFRGHSSRRHSVADAGCARREAARAIVVGRSNAFAGVLQTDLL